MLYLSQKVLQLEYSPCSLGLDLSCHLVCRVNFRIICLTRALKHDNWITAQSVSSWGSSAEKKSSWSEQAKSYQRAECAALAPHLYLMKSFSNLLIFHMFDCMLAQRRDWSPPAGQLLSAHSTDHNSYRLQVKKKSSLLKQVLNFL